MQQIKTKAGFWKASVAQLRKIRSIAGAGMLAALGTILETMVIVVNQFLQIGFAFLATALAGYMYGPLVSAVAAVVVDLLGLLLRPTGAFFFGFTLNALLEGFIYGSWLYRRPVKLGNVFGAVFSSMLIVNMLLNPLWLSIMYGNSFIVLLSARIVKNIIMLPINTFMLYFLLKKIEKINFLKKGV